jgi:putative chitinase
MMNVKILQTKIGAVVDGDFGPNTLKAAMKSFKLSAIRTVHLFSQIAHETGEFRTFSENLNYSAKRLREVFKKHFPTEELSIIYAYKPEKIANRVYANKIGNGNEASGDGWKYRGRGALQLTGKSNYKLFSDYIGDPSIMDNPDLVVDVYAFESAMYFFDKNNLWKICDDGIGESTIKKLTKKINGGYNGLDDRINLTKKYGKWLSVS